MNIVKDAVRKTIPRAIAILASIGLFSKPLTTPEFKSAKRGKDGKRMQKTGAAYPFSSARQDARGARLYMAKVNGFEVMQQRPNNDG